MTHAFTSCHAVPLVRLLSPEMIDGSATSYQVPNLSESLRTKRMKCAKRSKVMINATIKSKRFRGRGGSGAGNVSLTRMSRIIFGEDADLGSRSPRGSSRGSRSGARAWPIQPASTPGQLLLPVTQRNNFEGSLLGCIQSIEINRESFVEKLGVLSIKLLSVNV